LNNNLFWIKCIDNSVRTVYKLFLIVRVCLTDRVRRTSNQMRKVITQILNLRAHKQKKNNNECIIVICHRRVFKWNNSSIYMYIFCIYKNVLIHKFMRYSHFTSVAFAIQDYKSNILFEIVSRYEQILFT